MTGTRGIPQGPGGDEDYGIVGARGIWILQELAGAGHTVLPYCLQVCSLTSTQISVQ